MPELNDLNLEISPVEAPRQFDSPRIGLALVQADRLIRASQARNAFDVDGTGLTAAVLDTGLNTGHVDFAGRIITQVNLTADNGGNAADATDGNGHGTNVAGIIVANGDHRGIAPGASVIPIKVLTNSGGGSFETVDNALQWVLDHHEAHSIAAVCMSISDQSNRTSDDAFASSEVRNKIRSLREKKVAVVVSAGNEYFPKGSKQGMAFPAIIRECVSTGAVYDDFVGAFSYGNGAKSISSGPDRVTPFSQRLHPSVSAECFTDIFAPGAPVTSSGIQGAHGESVQRGTSQAAPVVAGVILLMQQLHKKLAGELAPVDRLVDLMRVSAVTIQDGDDEDDNVAHTNLDFKRLDAMAALDAVARQVQRDLLGGGAEGGLAAGAGG